MHTSSKKRIVGFVLFSAVVLGVGTLSLLTSAAWADEEKPGVTLPDEADQAWAEVEAAAQVLRPQFQGQPTPQQIQEVQKQMKEGAGPLADKAQAFVAKFPDHPKVANARQLAVQGLSMAVSLGDTAREEELNTVVDAALADKSVPEDLRVQMYLLKNAQLPLMKKLRANPAAATNFQAESERLMTETLIAAAKEFPNSKLVYGQLLSLARNKQGEEGKKIAQAIVDSEGAPDDVKSSAQDILDGKRPYELGKPLDIKFTAVDGREVDLSKMKGKVVLVDFWATWCGPCVAEIPNVKAVYDKYHDKGFEIVGISFDQDKDALLRFVEDKQLAWPQYFDGKGWANAYGAKYGIQSIPTVWLIGKDGNLADLNARGGLEQKVSKLLEAKLVQ